MNISEYLDDLIKELNRVKVDFPYRTPDVQAYKSGISFAMLALAKHQQKSTEEILNAMRIGDKNG